jgi:hypothetical protein
MGSQKLIVARVQPSQMPQLHIHVGHQPNIEITKSICHIMLISDNVRETMELRRTPEQQIKKEYHSQLLHQPQLDPQSQIGFPSQLRSMFLM